MSVRWRKPACLVLVGLALVVVLGGALGAGLWRRAHDPSRAPHNTLAGLRALPEDGLFYPGSAVLGRYGGDAYRNIGGGSDAWAGTYLGTNATKS